ncbi:MAG TPA: alpha/beta hydrolase [Stellaceae bacterium]|jgi:pimeloyl-ACP methyl ester carboxylesterase
MATHIPGPLYCEELGASGVPMIFCHSTPDDHRLWMFQTAHFSAWHRCLAVDLPGYGRSAAPQPGLRIEDMAEACWEVVDRITASGAIIHGNSLGSRVAQWMAALQPKRTLALILSGTGFGSSANMARWVVRYREEGIALRRRQVIEHFAPELQQDKLLNHYADMVCELSNAGTLASIIAVNEALALHYPPDLLGRITSPTLVIAGTKDFSFATVHEHDKHIKQSVLRTIEGAGHGVPIEAPAEYDRHCIDFLSSLGLFPGHAE